MHLTQWISAERNSRGFGKGKVIERLSRPSCTTEVGRDGENIVEGSATNLIVEKVSSILKKLALTIVEFGEVMAELGTHRALVEIIKKTLLGYL